MVAEEAGAGAGDGPEEGATHPHTCNLLYTYIHATCCTFLYGVNKAILKTRICAYRSNVQQEDDDQSVEPTESETYKFFNPERHVNQRQIDILPGLLPNDIYF